MKLKYILLFTLLFGINFQNTFSDYKKFNNINSFDWLLGIDNYSKIDSDVEVVDIDVLDADKKIVDKLHKKGQIVIGYLNIGSIETYRDDFVKFNKNIVGKIYPGWEDERFLDISKYELFKENILNRLDIAKQKGFDGIEPDNMDTYNNFKETGFKITKENEINYIKWFSSEVHKRGMFVIQKNTADLSNDLVNVMDGVLSEGAFYNNFENKFINYIHKNKFVLNVEYTNNTSKKDFLLNICPKSIKLGIISILKNRNLDDFILKCSLEKQYILTKNDKKITNNITKRVIKLLDKKNINYEVFINKIGIKINNLKLSKKIKAIIEDVLKNIKNISCNSYTLHSNITASVFWVGEESNASNAYISNNMSAWDEEWNKHFNQGIENKFYFALPYNDFDEKGDKRNNSNKIPWFKIRNWKNNMSIVKNRWIRINSNGKIAYAQWEDVGPINENDFDYVFGNKKYKNTFGLKAGIDLSPDLAKVLGLNGEGIVNWNFVPDYCVVRGKWTKTITISDTNWK